MANREWHSHLSLEFSCSHFQRAATIIFEKFVIITKQRYKNFQNIMPFSANNAIIRNSVYEQEGEAKLLPIGFAPGPMDVICSRGKSSFKHPGNCYYRKSIKSNLLKYSAAKTKADKGLIVSSIMNTIREASSSGIGFVKLMKDGCWYKVGENVVREKIGQSFRDLLHDKYSSSSKAKHLRRKNKDNLKASDSSERRTTVEKNIPSLTNCEDLYNPLLIDQAPFYAFPVVSPESPFPGPKNSNSRHRKLIDVMSTFISDNETKHIYGLSHEEDRIKSISLQSSVSSSFEPIPIDLAPSMSDFFDD